VPAGPDSSSPTARVLLSPRMDTGNPPSRTRKLRVMSVNVPGVATMGGKLELHDEPLVVGFLRGLDEGQDIADYRVGIRQGRPDGVASDYDGGAGPIDPRAYANESGLASVRGEVRSLYPAFGSASSHPSHRVEAAGCRRTFGRLRIASRSVHPRSPGTGMRSLWGSNFCRLSRQSRPMCRRSRREIPCCTRQMAEREGFEPSIRVTPDTAFPVRRPRPD
jgi:hypothetical protein